MRKIVILCGPTAVGKSKIGLELADKLNAEIVSADSQQVWRELDIGTAKPSPADRAKVAHHLIDVANPDEHFDVARYTGLAGQAIEDIWNRGKLVLVVGGAGMYIQTLLYGLCEAPPQDKMVRKKLSEEMEENGLHPLYERLQKIDPGVESRIHPNDKTRILRSLEVYALTGHPLSHFHSQHQKQEPRYEALQLGLNCDRTLLHEKINKRVDWMMANGWVEEVRELLKFYSGESQALQSIGYQQIVEYLRGEKNLKETTEEIKQATRALARRQMTWLRAQEGLLWYEPGSYQKILEKVTTWSKIV